MSLSSKRLGRNVLPIGLILSVALLYLASKSPPSFFPKWSSLTSPSSAHSSSSGLFSDDVWGEGYARAPMALDGHFSPVDLAHADHNEISARNLRDLHACLVLGNCGRNQKSVVLVTGDYFVQSLVLGWRGGEQVWAISMVKAIQQMGYTFLISHHWEETLAQYRMFPDAVKVVIGAQCLERGECFKSEANPTGVPRWKSEQVFSCHTVALLFVTLAPGLSWKVVSLLSRVNPFLYDLFAIVSSPDISRLSVTPKLSDSLPSSFDMMFFPWGGRYADIGWEWAIRADRWGPAAPIREPLHYIGYSIQADCEETAFVPQGVRSMSAWFYTKQATYFYSEFPEFGWNRSYFELARDDLAEYGLSFRGAYQVDEGFLPERISGGPMVPIPGVDNLGSIGPDEFADEVARSRILVGIGQPWLAPSAYLALCYGTPFLNVIKRWDENDPDDRSKWDSQHNILMGLDPPYVHNVRAGDYDGFLAAIRDAITRPSAERYIDPEMTEDAVRTRMRDLIERDWKSLAREKWADMSAEGNQPQWTI